MAATSKTRSKMRARRKSTASRVSLAKKRIRNQNIKSTQPLRTWKPNDFYTVEYIVSAKVEGNGKNRVWKYMVKWYDWGAEYNNLEPSSSFDNCSYPVLENFWKSVIHKPKVPDPRNYNANEVLESPALYRNYEIQKTMEMAKAGAAKWRDIKGPSDSETADEQDGQALSDTSDSSGEEFVKAQVTPTIKGPVGFKPGRGKTY